MTDMPKRPRGRPPKYAGQGVRQNLAFRVTPQLRERLIERVKVTGRSLSEEIAYRVERDMNWEDTREAINELRARIAAELSAVRIEALRRAGFQILRETSGKPTRCIVDIDYLFAEAGVATATRSGFIDPANPPRTEPTRRMTAEEEKRLLDEID